MAKNTEEKLSVLLDLLADYYKEKIKAGELSSNEQKNLIQLLRDNNITVEPNSGTPLDDILNGDFTGLDEAVEQYQ